MSEFFFNRHNNISPNIEPFNVNYSTNDLYYKDATGCDLAGSCSGYTSVTTDASRNEIINNCMCEYKKNVDNYLAKTSSDATINGVTNDSSEKYNHMTMKNVNLGIGLGLMLIYIYSTKTTA